MGVAGSGDTSLHSSEKESGVLEAPLAPSPLSPSMRFKQCPRARHEITSACAVINAPHRAERPRGLSLVLPSA